MKPPRPNEPLVSIVVAAHDEEACLGELYRRVTTALSGERCELLFVDDGSQDGTFDVVAALGARDPRVRGIRLSRNEGHQVALLCGLDFAEGHVVVTLDGDLQHPPELLPEMLASWRAGHDVVHMLRRPMSEARGLRDVLAGAFYALFNLVADVRLAPGSTDFRLLDRRCADALRTMRERFLRGMVRRIGFSQAELWFDSPPRFAGRTSYTLPKLWRVGIDALVSFSSVPLAVPLLSGAVTLALGATALVALLLHRSDSLGTWLLGVGSAAMLALSVVLLGFVATCLSRLMTELRREPLYFVERTVGRGFDGRELGPRIADRAPSDAGRATRAAGARARPPPPRAAGDLH